MKGNTSIQAVQIVMLHTIPVLLLVNSRPEGTH